MFVCCLFRTWKCEEYSKDFQRQLPASSSKGGEWALGNSMHHAFCHYNVIKRYRGHSCFIFKRHNNQYRDACNNEMHAGMSSPQMCRPIRRKVSHTTKDRGIKMAYKCLCPTTLFCSIFFVGLFCCCNTAKTRDGEKRKAYFHPVSDEVYDTLLLLVQGEFEVAVSKRNRIQRNRVVRFWKLWRLQKATISSGQHLCRFK